MKHLTIWCVLMAIVFCAVSQPITVDNLRKETSRTVKKDPDSTTWKWKRGGLLSLNLSQGSLSNWASGGDNFSLAVSSYFNYFFYYRKGRQFLDNNVDVNIGYVQTTSLGSRKNDDRFDYLSKYGYKIDTTGKWYLSGLFNFRSQFFDGYTYPSNIGVFSSSFLSPAYVILSAGFDYKANSRLSVFVSPLTSRWVIVMNNYLSKIASYGVDSGKHSVEEIGAFITVNYNSNFAKNVNYKGRLDLFSNYLNHPQNINFYMTNQLSCKVSKSLSIIYSLDLIYDDNIRLFGANGTSPALQTKSLIGVGFLMPMKIRKSGANSLIQKQI